MNYFYKDFYFIYLNKGDLIKPVNLTNIEKRISSLQDCYCLCYLNNYFLCDLLSNLRENVDTIFSQNVSFDKYQSNIKAIKYNLSPLLENKSKLLDSLTLHYYKMKSKHPSLYSLRFSFSLNDRTSRYAERQSAAMIRNEYSKIVDYLNKFLNLSRQRVLLKKIVGYFWVIMRDYAGLPYIHIGFYLSDGLFNARLAIEIKQLWEQVTDGYGCSLIFDVSENYGNSEVYNNNAINFVSPKSLVNRNNKKYEIRHDFNKIGDSTLKYFCSAENVKEYERYLTCIARESYPVYILNSITKWKGRIGLIDELHSGDRNLSKKKTDRKLSKFRGYSVSQIKKL